MNPFRSRIAVSLLAVSFSAPLAAAWPEWSLEIERISVGEASLERVRVSNDPPASGKDEGIEILIASVSYGTDAAAYGPFSLFCPGDLAWAFETWCRAGSWAFVLLEDWPELTGTLAEVRSDDTEIVVDTRGALDALAWKARLETAAGAFSLAVDIPEQPVGALAFLQPRLPPFGWVSVGSLSGSAEISGRAGEALEASAEVEFSSLDFDSPDGLYAGLGVGASVSGRLETASDGVFTLEGRLATGELLLQDFYRDFSGRALELSARIAAGQEVIDVQRVTVGDGDALHLAGQARLPLGQRPLEPELLLRELRLEFPEAYSRYLESVAAVFTLDGLDTEGVVTWSGDWAPGTARSGVLRLDGLTLMDGKRGRFAMRNLDGTLETGGASQLTWEAASFEKLHLGAGTAAIALAQESVSLLEPLSIEVLGGTLSLEELAVGFPRGGEPDIQLEAEITDVDMQQMSAALGWPEFAGTLSGSIPGINWSQGVIEIEGALDFEVFGGQVLLSDLRVERPFGVLPSLAANITADALDLEQLTRTFEFGRIAGHVDGYVRDLRMLDWRPVQFDAWFGTPQDSGRNDISRQAVQHLATIGGGSPTALLTGPVLRLFNDFSYRRLGLGCRLEDNVCHIRGIEEQGDAVLLLEGAGIPKISILAYNRAVDWPQLVAELTAVSGGEEVRIGK